MIKNIDNEKKKHEEGLKYLYNLHSNKNLSNNEIFETIYLCISLYYNSIKINYIYNSKLVYLNYAKKFLIKYFSIKNHKCIFSNNKDVQMLIELAACFSLECLYEDSTKLLMKVIENPLVYKGLKIMALEELFFESETFLPQAEIDYYKKIYNNLKQV